MTKETIKINKYDGQIDQSNEFVPAIYNEHGRAGLMATELLNRLAARAAGGWRVDREGDDAMTVASRRQMLVGLYRAIISIYSARSMARIIMEGVRDGATDPG